MEHCAAERKRRGTPDEKKKKATSKAIPAIYPANCCPSSYTAVYSLLPPI